MIYYINCNSSTLTDNTLSVLETLETAAELVESKLYFEDSAWGKIRTLSISRDLEDMLNSYGFTFSKMHF